MKIFVTAIASAALTAGICLAQPRSRTPHPRLGR